MFNLNSKLPHLGETIFGEMSAIAKSTNAIDLGQGYPDYAPPAALIEAVCKAMHQGHNQYAPMQGLTQLRHAIASRISAQHGKDYCPENEITITSGATEALMSTFLALINSGEEVVLLDPAYDVYEPAVQLAGGICKRVPMQAPETGISKNGNNNKFSVDWDLVASAINTKTRALVINFPHNPSGLSLKDHDLDALEQIVAKHPKLLIISDEAYEYIVFDGVSQKSPVARSKLAENSVMISSFGKTFHATGWKIGYCCAPTEIMREIRKVHQFMVYSVSTPMQAGIAEFMQSDSTVISGLSNFYEKKRDRLYQGLLGSALNPLPSEGTFFMLVDASALNEPSAKQLAIKLSRQIGVTSIPVSAFYQDQEAKSSNQHLLRLCFAKQDATIDTAIERIRSL